MEEINKEFNIPYYIFEEIVEYIELKGKNHNKPMKWRNIEALLRLAILNKKITKEQADFLIQRFNREHI